MHTTSYMSVITYLILRAIPAIHEITALRPWSVDSLNGGSTDALKKAPVEKRNWSFVKNPSFKESTDCRLREVL